MRVPLFVTLVASLATVDAQPPKLKVFLSVDMEGVAGVVTADQLMPGSFEYERFRHMMTDEALAAVEGARQGGATEIVVADAHGNSQNLLIEQFPADVRMVRGSPTHLGMMGGLDATFDAAMFVGYHASTHNMNGVRAHTFSSGLLTRVTLNGAPVTEGAWNAAIAGQFGVPVIFMSGDDAAAAEVKAAIGDIEAVETKRSMGFHAAETLMPAAVQKLIRERAAIAVKGFKSRKPYLVTKPVAIEISFKNITPVESAAYLRQVFTRSDSHTLRFAARDMAEASDTLEFLLAYRADLTP
jgi:D-amino peptidase